MNTFSRQSLGVFILQLSCNRIFKAVKYLELINDVIYVIRDNTTNCVCIFSQ